MRNTVIWSFLSLVAVATVGLVSGCDSDAKIARGSAGDSCTNTTECNDKLRCIDGICAKPGSGMDNNQAGEGSGTAGVPGVTPTPPVLGGPGESCTKRADCEDGLACLSQRCTADGGGMGGAGSVGPMLGGPGETCGLTTDCAEGLRCLPLGNIVIDALGSAGVCTPVDTGLQASGKTCGHECVEAADCCELPIAQQTATGAKSCSDLAVLVGAVANCDTAVGLNGLYCLAYSAYCDDQCGKNTWACTGGQCQYTAKCTKATQVVGGCPAYTRGGGLIPSCDVKSSKCVVPAAAPTGCAKDTDCDKGLVVADHPIDDTCSEGECACHTETGGCYRKCSEDLDCVSGYKCDDTTSLCTPLGSCTTDLECIQDYGDVRRKCIEGSCTKLPCEHDIDCNPGGFNNGNFRQVCGADKICQDLGCSTNDECVGVPLAGGVRSFCAEPAVGAPGVAVVSAITD